MKKLFHELSALTTERRNPRSLSIDTRPLRQVLSIINREDQAVARAVARQLPYIEEAVKIVVQGFRRGGRLIYVGAGTSGRLGILDASECPPTFGVKPAMVQGLIAGGKKAVFRSQEGAEDRSSDAVRDLRKLKLSKDDVVCGIAASMRTPYVVRALRYARERGTPTLFITTNPRSLLTSPKYKSLRGSITVAICPDVGPEAIMGSTRMKSGTAQKMVLNMISTAAMIRLGKVYQNMMVDLRMTSRKLQERANRVLMIATGVDYETAQAALRQAGGHVKTALVMIRADVPAAEARRRLKRSSGFVAPAIQNRTYLP
jgi:N-acetylmuramic acid 6-phosphate etherase